MMQRQGVIKSRPNVTRTRSDITRPRPDVMISMSSNIRPRPDIMMSNVMTRSAVTRSNVIMTRRDSHTMS